MIGFESGLTGETAVEAIINATQLFSGDMTPARIKEVVYKFESESGGYKEVNAFKTDDRNTIYQPVMIVVNPKEVDQINLLLKNENLVTLLNDSNSNTTGFHRIKFIKGVAFTTDKDVAGLDVFKDLYVDINVSGEKFYGEFLIPGLLKGVFTFDGEAVVSVRSILCPVSSRTIGNFLYQKAQNDPFCYCTVILNFFSDALLLFPKTYRFPSYSYYPNDSVRVQLSIQFDLASGDLVAQLYYTTSLGSGNAETHHIADSYHGSFALGVDAYYANESWKGSYAITAPTIPPLSSYITFSAEDSFINK